MASDRATRALLVLGLVLLPGPAYAVGFEVLDGPDRSRSPTGYSAPEIDVSDDSWLATRYANMLSFETTFLKYRSTAEDYRAPNRTRRVLEQAVQEGTATTGDRAVRADLRRIERNHTFLTISSDAFYSYAVSSGTVETTPTNDSVIANAVRSRLVARYGSLSDAERTTFRKIRAATESDEQYDYRPWADEPVPDEAIVERDGAYYAVQSTSSTDDFDFPDGLFLGVFGSAIGFLVLLAWVILKL